MKEIEILVEVYDDIEKVRKALSFCNHVGVNKTIDEYYLQEEYALTIDAMSNSDFNLLEPTLEIYVGKDGTAVQKELYVHVDGSEIPIEEYITRYNSKPVQ